jgi:drug/metabolite transporter (DMT)-like permease
MLAGIGFGLLSSFALGVGDLSAGLLARRFGTIRVAAAELAVSLTLLLGLLVVAGLALPTQPGWIAWIAAVAGLRAFGYFALIRAFSIGPVAVVGPIVAGNTAVTVLAAMILLGERPTPLQLAAVAIATLGSMLIVIVVDQPARRVRVAGSGPLLAVVAMVALAIVVAAQQPPIREIGWLPTIALRRLVEAGITWTVLIAAVFLGFAPVSRIAKPAVESEVDQATQRWIPRSPYALLAVGLIDTVGLSSLAIALDVAPAWLFGVVGSVGPVVALTYGMVVLGERLRPAQWLGIALVIVAIVLVGLG